MEINLSNLFGRGSKTPAKEDEYEIELYKNYGFWQYRIHAPNGRTYRDGWSDSYMYNFKYFALRDAKREVRNLKRYGSLEAPNKTYKYKA